MALLTNDWHKDTVHWQVELVGIAAILVVIVTHGNSWPNWSSINISPTCKMAGSVDRGVFTMMQTTDHQCNICRDPRSDERINSSPSHATHATAGILAGTQIPVVVGRCKSGLRSNQRPFPGFARHRRKWWAVECHMVTRKWTSMVGDLSLVFQ